jgi:hypothetical protein
LLEQAEAEGRRGRVIVRISRSRGKEGKSEGTSLEQAEAERRRERMREHS